MTVSTEISSARYLGNGVTDTFAFNGRIFSTSDLAVDIITRATDALVETLSPSDYTVVINGAESASVIVDAPKIPTGSQDILIRRDIPITQSLRLPTGTVFPASDVENGLDKITVISQAVFADLARAIKLPVTSSLTDVNLPTPVASQLIGWNATGDDLATYSFAVITTDLDTIFTTLTTGDFLTYDGTVWRNRAKGSVPMDGAQATGSAGLSLKNSGGTTVLNVGAGGGTGATFAGGVNAGGEITATGYLNVAGTSSGPAYITMAEDTDNGTNKVTIIAPASIASDYTLTLPSTGGTLARTADIPNVSSISTTTTLSTGSPTQVDINIPANIRQFTVNFAGMSFNASAQPSMLLGTSGSFETTGYSSVCSFISTAVGTGAVSTSIIMTTTASAATVVYQGSVVFTLVDASTNEWAWTGSIGDGTIPAMFLFAGSKSLASALTRIRLTSAAGTATFDAGKANVFSVY